MKAIHVQSDREGLPLVWQETPDPICGPDEVRVEIHAAALNRADLLQRAGGYPPPPGAPDILGMDIAGRIAEVGSNVPKWQVGDRVCALVPGGGYAEQVAIHHRMLMPMVNGWSYAQGAAVPEVFLTAYVNIFMEARFQNGDTVLVHGGASGVGTAAIQLVREAGGRCIVTAGSDAKTAACQELGAHLAVNYQAEDFVAAVESFTGGAGVDIILDMVGANYLERNLSLLKLKGRLVLIAMLGGSTAEINLATLMRRRLRLIGSVLRSRSLAERAEIVERFSAQFWPLLQNGTLRPVIDRIYPIQEANAAHEQMAANRNIGKIILQVRG